MNPVETDASPRTPRRRPPPPWGPDHPLAQWLLEAPHEFQFFQLVNLVERLQQDMAPLGASGPVAREPLRLRPALSLGFPAGDVAEGEWREFPASGRILLTTTFLGLYGSDSPLPVHFTESLLPQQDEDERVREFLDLFHHRLLSLVYRAWLKYRYYATFRPDGRDAISQVVRGLLGLGTDGLDENVGVSPVALFRYAGLLSQRPRSAAGLAGQLRDYFDGVPIRIEQCVARWLWIQPGDRNVLGQRKCALGRDFLVGERVRDRGGKFRVKVGPVGLDKYVDFLPPGKGAAELAALVRFYCGDPLEFDIGVTLRGEEVPDSPLGEHGLIGRLAWTSWVKSQPSADREVVFAVPA